MNHFSKIVILLSFLFIACDESSSDISGSTDKDYSGFTGDGTGASGNGDSTIQAGQITAGEWNDLNNWTFWNNLQQNSDLNKSLKSWTFFPFKRYCFKITDANNQPLINCTIKLKKDGAIVWESKTDNHGKAELWNQLFIENQTDELLSATLSYSNNTVQLDTVLPFSIDTNKVIYPISSIAPTQVDIHFMVDATGSMGDELEYLKVELQDVIQRINSENPNLNFRYGSVFYRDSDDEYVTRSSAFNADKTVLIDFIENQIANGGGDFPEAVHTALNETLFNQEWGINNRASLCFLLLDAPPHNESQIISSINQYTQAASKMGIKLIPITASGIDYSTEFLMRSLAVSTNGTYIFITGDSGIGGEHLVPTVGTFEVELLNQLLIRVINEHIK